MQSKFSENEAVSQAESPRQYGVVTCLKSPRGFGFILADDRQSWFFHNSACRNGKIPATGDRVSFRPSTDRKGRTNAVGVRIESAAGGAL